MQRVVVLNNIRSLHNVGSIFRTSEAFSINKLYLCGITGTPENPRMQKTALTGFNAVPWEYKKSALRTIKDLKQQGFAIIALEITDNSQPIEPMKAEKVALIVGHERQGVDAHILEQADEIMHIPMQGLGKSLNVSVAFGIAAYHIFH